MKFEEISLPLDKIVFDENLQIRVKLSEERIEEFSQIFDQLPPVKVVREEDVCYLADGFHRYKTAQGLDEKTLRCFVANGTYKEALEIAVKENAKGPLNLSREDKRRAVTKMLMFFTQRANSWIAEDAGVSMQTVELVRTELESSGTIKQYDELLRRDEKTTPRVYQKLSSLVSNKETSLVPGLDDMSQQERQDLMRLSTKALGRQYADPLLSGSKLSGSVQEPFSKDTLQSIQKAFSAEQVRRPTAKDAGEILFVGTDDGVFAEVVDIDRSKGIRVRMDGSAVVINIYEAMKSGERMFPKTIMKLEPHEFGGFLISCSKYLESVL